MIKLTIDNKVVEAEEGSTILEAAEEAGIFIPTLCSHESLTPIGSCRLCSVEVVTNGTSNLTSSCTYPVEEGLEVKTNSERVVNARKMAMELLLAQHPHSVEIEKLARKLGIEKPGFTLEEKECILCSLCVRACHEIVGVDAITFIAQGIGRNTDGASVVHSAEKCIGCDSCAYVCPTDAITVEDVGDTRIINTPGGKMEFKLKRCKTCGNYWAPEKQLDHIVKKLGLAPEVFDNCPDCRE